MHPERGVVCIIEGRGAEALWRRGRGDSMHHRRRPAWASWRGGMHHRGRRSVCIVGGKVCIIEGEGAYAS
jgi:hypothetical protein